MIILLGFESGAGKNTVGDLLVPLFKMKYPKKRVRATSFASALKEDCYRMFAHLGMKDELYYENNRIEKTKFLTGTWTPVDIWIKVSETLKQIDPFMWSRRLFKTHNPQDILIVRDLRFVPEVKKSEEVDPIVKSIWVRRENLRLQASDHAMRNYQDWYRVLDNNGTLGDLSVKVHTLFEDLCGFLEDK